jgi:hypothetical protein
MVYASGLQGKGFKAVHDVQQNHTGFEELDVGYW